MPESAPVSHIRTARPQQVIKQSSNYPKHILPTGRASHAIRQSLLEPSNETSHSTRHFVSIESYKSSRPRIEACLKCSTIILSTAALQLSAATLMENAWMCLTNSTSLVKRAK